MTLAKLRQRVPAQQLHQSERVSFHIFFLVTQGVGSHTIDLINYPLKTGSLVSIQPGQVHQWQKNSELDGYLMLFIPSALSTSTSLTEWPSCCHLPEIFAAQLCTSLKQLSHDVATFQARALDIALIRQGLIYLLLRIARWHNDQPIAENSAQSDRAIYRLFICELEKRFHHRLSVHSFASTLGYSQSTLSRACRAAVSIQKKGLQENLANP